MTFRVHPDGIVYFDEQAIPLDLVKERVPEFVLPDRAISCEYIPGERVTFSDGGNVLTIHELKDSWPEADALIARKDEFVQEHEARRLAALLPVGPPKIWEEPQHRRTVNEPVSNGLVLYGNVMVNRHYFKAGDVLSQHAHRFDHLSLLIKGSVKVQMGADETILSNYGEIIIRKNVEHRIEALEDNTIWLCVFAVRDEDGQAVEIVGPAHDPSFSVS